ncbi:MAG: anaerobic sulfatase maturase [Calditrichaeota bacterium]|nr:anaerobic sulfatase maturase [Calditrichota bacterium]
MPIFVNGQEISEAAIQAEITRMRPMFDQQFSELPPEEREEKLRQWAEDNAVERLLLEQEAQKRGYKIRKSEVDREYRRLVQEYGSPEALQVHFGVTARDKLQIRLAITRQIRVQRLIADVCSDPSRSEAEQLDAFLENLRSKADIRVTKESAPKAYRKALTSVLVKPAGPDCNLACTYCFYLEKASLFPRVKMHRMNEAILEEMTKQILKQGGPSITIGWQGGEPTLMGLPFFEKAVEFQKTYAQEQTVGNGLQTNGILLDQNWAHFLGKNQFLIGLSLDGPRHIHDHYRLFRGGQGSWEQVVDRAKLLLDAGVAVNALTVVSDYSAQFPEEIYAFHKSLGLTYMQFIPCVETDPRDPTRAAPFSVSPEQYGRFLQKVFDLWWSDFKNGQPTTSVRFFESVFYTYVGLTPPDCTLHKECGIYVVVEHNGDVYACDFFVEPRWRLGNVMEDQLIDLLNSPKQDAFGKVKVHLPKECLNCPWLQHCWGGCPKDRLRDPRDQGSNHFCRSYKMFFEHADARLQELARVWKRTNRM